MEEKEQINRLIKKGGFAQPIKTDKPKNEFWQSLKITGLALFVLISLFLLIQLIPASSIEISSDNQTGQAEKKQSPSVLSVFKSILPLKLTVADNSATNILALGQAGQGYAGGDLTDTIILIHFNQEKNKALLISLPRDLLVSMPGRNGLTKINALYNLVGIDGLKEKIKEITGLSVDYYAVIDLAVFKEVIDLVDGLNVYVPQDINDPFFPGPNYSYQAFVLSAGWRYLDGDLALKYVRTRYTSPNGDFDRMARQQQIIQLLKQKVLALNPLWDFPTYLKIFNSLQNHIETDLSILQMNSFFQKARQMKTDQINNLVIDKKETDLLTGGLIDLGGQPASVVYPKTGQENYTEIKKYIKKFID